MGFTDKTAGQHLLVCCFMRGLHHKLTVCRPLVPLEELSINLNAPSHNPFELSEVVGLKFLLLKTALPFGLTQASKGVTVFVRSPVMFTVRPRAP